MVVVRQSLALVWLFTIWKFTVAEKSISCLSTDVNTREDPFGMTK